MARIVFDLDGTLIDSAPDIHGIANTLLTREGLEPITLEQTRSFIGNGVPVFVTRMRAERNIGDTEQARLLADFVALYDDAVTLTQPYPGVSEALAALAGNGHDMGICTNKPLKPCIAVLRHLQLDRYFPTIVGGDSLPVRKPDPAPLQQAFDDLGPGPCLYVGDSEVDAETAQRANVPFLLFTRGYRKSPISALPHLRAFDDFGTFPDMVAAVLKARA